MKKIVLNVVTIISILLVSESTLASNESIKIRMKNQELLIQKGCDKGQLTKREKTILKNEQKKIKKLIRKLSKDQDFSAKDQSKVHAVLDQARLHIFKKRYNKKAKNKKN